VVDDDGRSGRRTRDAARAGRALREYWADVECLREPPPDWGT
jgi:hypothetical protein